MAKNKKELDVLNIQNNPNKKKKRKTVKYILLIILFLILAAVVAAAINFYSLWRTAKDFEKNLDLAHFSYVVDVELERDGLTKEQLALIDSLARISGLEQKDFTQMHIEGSVWEDKVYAEVFLPDSAIPVIEVYLSKGDDLINASLFYEAIRSEMAEKYALLGEMLPIIEENFYMTMEQAEELTGEDMGSVRDFEPFFSRYDLSALEYFAALAALPHLEHEEGSALVLKELKEPSGTNGKKVSLYFEVEQPAQVVERNVERYGKILTQLNINIDGSGFKALKRLAVTLSSDGVQEIVMPVNVMSRKQFETIEEIRRMAEDIASMMQSSPQGLLDVISGLLGGYMGNQN